MVLAMDEHTPTPEGPTDVEVLLAAIDERDAEIERLKERIRFLEFTPEHAAERIKNRATPNAAYDQSDGPRGNMGQSIMRPEDFYAFMRANWPTRSR